MSQFKFVNLEYGTVYPPPLTNGNPPAQPQPDDAPRPSPRTWAVLAALWYICHLAIVGAVIVTLLVDAEGFCTSPLQPVAAVPVALALWAVTLFMARRGTR
jgi:hypothetical protein